MVTSRAPTISAYLQTLPPDRRAVLAQIRKTIKATVPGARESMEYGMPVLRKRGWACAFNAQKRYFSLYINDFGVVKRLASNRKGLDCGRSCIRFTRAENMPPALVAKLVRESYKRTA